MATRRHTRYDANPPSEPNKPITLIAGNPTLAAYVRASEATGSAVRLDPDYGCLPILVGNNDQPVFLYEVVEALDGAVDYQALRAEFPNLSFGQIAGALALLRKLAQFNTRGVDIDQLKDALIEGSAEFQAQMAVAMADQEVRRVPTGE